MSDTYPKDDVVLGVPRMIEECASCGIISKETDRGFFTISDGTFECSNCVCLRLMRERNVLQEKLNKIESEWTKRWNATVENHSEERMQLLEKIKQLESPQALDERA